MPNTTIYHNPRCSKSRETLALLNDQGIEPNIVKYLDTPPDRETLQFILDGLNMQPRDLMRTKEKEYKALNLDDEHLSNDQLMDAMLANPRLIERPIVIHGGKVAIGRPPTTIVEILS